MIIEWQGLTLVYGIHMLRNINKEVKMDRIGSFMDLFLTSFQTVEEHPIRSNEARKHMWEILISTSSPAPSLFIGWHGPH
jgi:hypothetical protein